MKKVWKALAAFLLALMLPLGGACASIAGLDETLAGYLDTVSYTHLDVYKRQLLFHKDSTRQLMEKVFAGNGNFQGEDAGRKRP